MYMCVSDLPILSREGIAKVNNMMQPHGSGRMEVKHEHEGSENELSRIKLGFHETRFTRRQTRVCEMVNRV